MRKQDENEHEHPENQGKENEHMRFTCQDGIHAQPITCEIEMHGHVVVCTQVREFGTLLNFLIDKMRKTIHGVVIVVMGIIVFLFIGGRLCRCI